jgi:hypothetical protein
MTCHVTDMSKPKANWRDHPAADLLKRLAVDRLKREQVKTRGVPTEAIMRSADFRRGFEDVRSGRPARFDDHHEDDWSYERGRQFAYIAPASMPLKIDGKLNPKAVILFEAAHGRGYVI